MIRLVRVNKSHPADHVIRDGVPDRCTVGLYDCYQLGTRCLDW